MPDTAPPPLLAAGDPAPVTVLREHGASRFFFTCDHASARLPAALGDLGLPPEQRLRHIAWDIGAAALTTQLSAVFDAPAVLQNYSRLAIDCNRPLDAFDSIATVSEGVAITGNEALSVAARRQRQDEIFHPYHARIRDLLDARASTGRLEPTILVSMHSFTPVYLEVARRWHASVMYHRDTRYALPVLEVLREETQLTIGENEPYRLGDVSDYTVPVHAEARGLLHVMLEIRQDLVTTQAGQAAWAQRLARVLAAAAERLS
jgi:predicted N-formylglutamate amidohydrolase